MTDGPLVDLSEEPQRQLTAPANFQVSLRGFETEDGARAFGTLLGSYINEISRYIDLTRLDGVTVAYDYEQALAELDRGVPGLKTLTRTEHYGVGVAMTPAVVRDGIVKAHIVLAGDIIRPLEDETHEFWKDCLYTLAHECAHVEVDKAFDECFPGVTLQRRHSNFWEAFRWQIIDSCWDEYAASRISGMFGGEQQRSNYEETFVTALGAVRDAANAAIKRYRIHGEHGKVAEEVTREYAVLMRYAAYLQGHLAGTGENLSAAKAASHALAGHWFQPYYARMEAIMETLWSRFGRWENLAEFKPLGDVADDLVGEGGVVITPIEEDEVYIAVPYTPDTMPSPEEEAQIVAELSAG